MKTENPLLSPPPSPLLSPIYSSLINDRLYQSTTICKTFCGLIQDGLFTNWKIGFDSDPQLHYLKRLVLELFRVAWVWP